MMTLRRASGVLGAAILLLGLGGSSPAFGQFDMVPYRPYSGGYRPSSYPAELMNSGDPGARSPYFALRQSYRQLPFEARVAQELDAMNPTTPAPATADAKGSPAAEGATLAGTQRKRDEYYFKAMDEANPKKKAALMELYRREDRKLDRDLSATRPRPSPARLPRPRHPPRPPDRPSLPRSGPPPRGHRRVGRPPPHAEADVRRGGHGRVLSAIPAARPLPSRLSRV